MRTTPGLRSSCRSLVRPALRPTLGRVQRDVVDGVPVLWASAPGALAAGLVFGVGRRDETFLRGGLTHLVEHLTMASVGRTSLECNASVDLTTTEFTASGRPERIAEFLRLVCTALWDLPLQRLPVEADVLRVEAGAVARPSVGALLAERYGARGAGLAGFQDVAVSALTREDVQAWAATHFVRGNAALWLSGPPPDGLSLPLPPGERPPRPPQRVLPLRTPALVEHAVDGAVALGAEVARLPGLGAAGRVLRNRVEDDLRHRRGVSYTVDLDQLAVDGDRRFVAVSADCRDGQEAVAARALWQGLVRLAGDGPTSAELLHERDSVAEFLADPSSGAQEAAAAAAALVTDTVHRTSDELQQEAQALAPEQVREAAQALRDGALLGAPQGVELALSGMTKVPEWSAEVLPGRTFPRRRLGSDAPRGAHLVIGDEGVSVVLGAAEQLTVRFADTVALLRVAPQEWSMVGVDGRSIPLDPHDWRDGDQALATVQASVPERMQVSADPATAPARQVVLLQAPPHAATEALWPSRRDAWVLQTERWTLLVREQDQEAAYGDAAGLSAALGRRRAVLVLEQAHDELSLVVVHRRKERDRHLWTGEEHDPSVLAELLGVPPDEVVALLAHSGRPEQVLAELTTTLGIPPEVAQVLSGVPLAQVPGLVLERARGVRETVVAAGRGEFDPPDGTALHHRLTRWQRERPPSYRAASAAGALGQVAIAAVLASRVDGDLISWTGGLAAVFAAGAVNSLWGTMPPTGGR